MPRNRKPVPARVADASDAGSVVALLLADDPTTDDNAELRRLLRANAKIAEPAAEVGGYTRISEFRAERNADGSIGVLRQALRILRHANEREIRVVRWYCDNDFSAANPNVKRPSYLALLEDMRARRVNGLLVWDIPRLYRQNKEFQELVDLYDGRPRGDKPFVATTDGQLDLSTEIGRFVAELLVLVGKLESANTSKRIRDKKEARFSEGAWQGGTIPYGYRHAGKGRLEIEPSEADVIREAAKQVLEGWSLTRICRHLNSSGRRGRKGAPWRTQTIRAQLLNPLYAGIRSYQPFKPLSSEPDGECRQIPTDKWPAILSDHEMTMLRAILTAEERRTTPEHGGAVRRYLGSGALTCGVCGSKNVYGRPRAKSNGRPQTPCYQCRDCRGFAREHLMVDEFLRAFLLEAAASEAELLTEALATKVGDDSGRPEVLARLGVVQGELAKDPGVVVRDLGLTLATYASLRAGLEHEERELLARLAPAERRTLRVLPPVGELADVLDDPGALQTAHDLLVSYLDTYGLEVVVSRVGRGVHNYRHQYTMAERPDLFGVAVRRIEPVP